MESTSRTLLVTTAALLLMLGLGFVLVPRPLFASGSSALDLSTLMLVRVAGSALCGLGAIAGLLRGAPAEARRLTHRGFAIFFLMESVVILMALLGGALTLWGWVFLASSIPLFATHAGAGFESAESRGGA